MAPPLQVDVTNRQILKIMLPISLALLVPNLNFIINNIFLGHLSEQALATASITGVYYLIFSSVGFGLNNGLQMLIARRAGENRPQEIGTLFNQGVLIALVLALLSIGITYTLAAAILKTAVHNPETFQQSILFLHIRIWGLPFLYIYQMRNALLIGINQSKYLVAGTLAEAIANVFFDYVLIFGKWGFPMLGFNGAAYASVIAEFIGMVVIFLVITAKGIGRQYGLLKKLVWEQSNIRLILKISLPLVFQFTISIMSWWFFYLLVEHHGRTSLAVSNTMRNVFGFFGVFIWSFAATTSTMVSNIIGQGRKDQVLPIIQKIIRLNAGIMLLVCLVLNLFPKAILSIYGQSEAFITAAIPILRLISFAMVLMAVAVVWLNAVTGTGSSNITFRNEVVATVAYSIYVYLVLEVYKLPILWGWMSEILYWCILLTLSYFYIRSGRWQKKVI
jgi:multidrug resistance protein, MATE family